jgi:chromosome segregation ATPase
MKFFKAPEANAKIEELEAKVQTLEGAAAKHGEAIAAKDKSLSELQAKLDQALQSVSAKDGDITTLKASVTTITGERDQALGKVTKLEAEAKTAEERATQILAGMGINEPVKKEGNKEEAKSDGKTEEQLWAEYHALPDGEKRAFYVKHEKVLGRY